MASSSQQTGNARFRALPPGRLPPRKSYRLDDHLAPATSSLRLAREPSAVDLVHRPPDHRHSGRRHRPALRLLAASPPSPGDHTMTPGRRMTSKTAQKLKPASSSDV